MNTLRQAADAWDCTAASRRPTASRQNKRKDASGHAVIYFGSAIMEFDSLAVDSAPLHHMPFYL